jgi:hypothetical protein
MFRLIGSCFVWDAARRPRLVAASTVLPSNESLMQKPSLLANRFRILALLCVFLSALVPAGATPVPEENGSPASRECRVDPVDFEGWHGQQMSNPWMKLIFVPENGGRLMQVIFAGHPYLFVNPGLAGKYFPPTNGKWFNYGGDKLWLLPEGNDDEQHWPGNSDLIDDGPFTFRKLSEGKRCEIELTSPADPQTGIQFSRTIRLDADSPQVRFHASMKNISGHTLDWSMQSVSQYNTLRSACGHHDTDSWPGRVGPPVRRCVRDAHARLAHRPIAPQ